MALGGAMLIDRLGRRTLFVSASTNPYIALHKQPYFKVISNAGMLCGTLNISTMLNLLTEHTILCSFRYLDYHSSPVPAPGKHCSCEW